MNMKNMSCRLYSQDSDETQEHLQFCEGTRFERRGAEFIGLERTAGLNNNNNSFYFIICIIDKKYKLNSRSMGPQVTVAILIFILFQKSSSPLESDVSDNNGRSFRLME